MDVSLFSERTYLVYPMATISAFHVDFQLTGRNISRARTRLATVDSLSDIQRQPDKGCARLTVFILAVFEVSFVVLNTKFKLISFLH